MDIFGTQIVLNSISARAPPWTALGSLQRRALDAFGVQPWCLRHRSPLNFWTVLAPLSMRFDTIPARKCDRQTDVGQLILRSHSVARVKCHCYALFLGVFHLKRPEGHTYVHFN